MHIYIYNNRKDSKIEMGSKLHAVEAPPATIARQ